MDRYILILSLNDNESITDSIGKLCKSDFKNKKPTNQSVSKSIPLLSADYSTYISVLSPQNVELDNPTWSPIEKWETGISGNTKKDYYEPEEISVGLAQLIHKLADRLSPLGTFLLDVLLLCSDLSDPEFHIDLYGALKRLVLWCNARVLLVGDNDVTESPSLEVWSEVLDAAIVARPTIEGSEDRRTDSPVFEVAAPPTFHDPHVVWKGNVQFNGPDGGTVSLPKFILVMEEEPTPPSVNNPSNSVIIQDRIFFSTSLTVVDQVTFSQIPPIFLTSHFLRLEIGSGPDDTEARDFLRLANQTPDSALILRLQYGASEDWLKEIPETDSIAWGKHIAMKRLKAEEVHLMMASPQISLLLRSDGNGTDSHATVQVLRDRSEVSEAGIKSLVATPNLEFKSSNPDVDDLLSSVPVFNAKQAQCIERLVQAVQMKVFQHLLVSYPDVEPSTDVCTQVLSMVRAQTYLSDSVVSLLPVPMGGTCYNNALSYRPHNQHLVPVDPTDWEERQFLILREAEMRFKADKHGSGGTLSSMAPAPTANTAGSIDLKTVLRLFDRDGSAMSNIARRSLPVCSTKGRSPLFRSSSSVDIRTEEWPSVRLRRHHDVYYNTDDAAEAAELVRNNMAQRMVVNDTASTFMENSRPTAMVIRRTSSGTSLHSDDSADSFRRRGSSGTPARSSSQLSGSLFLHSPRNYVSDQSAKKSIGDATFEVRRSPRKLARERSFSLDHRKSPRKMVLELSAKRALRDSESRKMSQKSSGSFTDSSLESRKILRKSSGSFTDSSFEVRRSPRRSKFENYVSPRKENFSSKRRNLDSSFENYRSPRKQKVLSEKSDLDSSVEIRKTPRKTIEKLSTQKTNFDSSFEVRRSPRKPIKRLDFDSDILTSPKKSYKSPRKTPGRSAELRRSPRKAIRNAPSPYSVPVSDGVRRTPKKIPYLDTVQDLRRSPRKRISSNPSYSDVITPRRGLERDESQRSRSGSAQRLGRERTQSAPVRQTGDPSSMSELHVKKLRAAVADALEAHGIDLKHPLFPACGKKLFSISKTFVKDLLGTGRTSEYMKKVTFAHVKQVIEFEQQINVLNKSR